MKRYGLMCNAASLNSSGKKDIARWFILIAAAAATAAAAG